MVRILAAADEYEDEMPSHGMENARRIRGLILLLRYSGTRISDAVNCSTDRIEGNRLFLYTRKTGVPVNTILSELEPGWINGERTTIRVGRQRCRERTAVTPRTLASACTEQQ